VAAKSPDLGPFAYNVCGVMQQRVYQKLFRNVYELKKQLVEVWSRTLSTLLSMNGENLCVPVFAQGLIFRIFAVSGWTTGQTVSESDRNLDKMRFMRVILIK